MLSLQGKTLYKGMLLTIRLMTMALFEPSSAKFILESIEMVGGKKYIY